MLNEYYYGLFKRLNDKEEKAFRKYARENDPPKMADWDIYHPVCRDEWTKRGITPQESN